MWQLTHHHLRSTIARLLRSILRLLLMCNRNLGLLLNDRDSLSSLLLRNSFSLLVLRLLLLLDRVLLLMLSWLANCKLCQLLLNVMLLLLVVMMMLSLLGSCFLRSLLIASAETLFMFVFSIYSFSQEIFSILLIIIFIVSLLDFSMTNFSVVMMSYGLLLFIVSLFISFFFSLDMLFRLLSWRLYLINELLSTSCFVLLPCSSMSWLFMLFTFWLILTFLLED